MTSQLLAVDQHLLCLRFVFNPGFRMAGSGKVIELTIAVTHRAATKVFAVPTCSINQPANA
jgi:hypothetical protein